MPQGVATLSPLSVLRHAQASLGNGQSNLMLLEAEAGLGKSHALRIIANQTSQGLVFTTPSSHWLASILRLCQTNLELERDPAFLEAARRIAPDLKWAQVAQAPNLNDQNSLWNAAAHALERLAKRVGGLTLLLEDAHDASADDLGSLRALYRRALLGQAPIQFVITSKPSQPDVLEGFIQDAAIANAPEPTRVVLSKLEAAGVDELLQEHLHSKFLPENLSAWLYARAEGHPLHTLELLRFLQDGGSLRRAGVIWVFRVPLGKAVPQKLDALLKARLQGIQSDGLAWTAMRALCVFEKPIRVLDWSQLCSQSVETMLEVAQRLEFGGLIRESLELAETIFTVAHPLYVPLVKAQTVLPEFQSLHRKAMRFAKTNSERARHARAAGHEQAAELSRLAWQEAEQCFAYAQVLEHAEYLLTLELQDSATIRTSFANALFIQGETNRALEITRGAASDPGLLSVRFHVLLRLGEFQQALEATREAQQYAENDLTPHLNEALALMHLEQLDEAGNVIQNLLKRFPEPGIQHGKALDILSDIVYSKGNLRASLEIGMRAVKMLREFGDQKNLAITLTNLGGCCVHFGLWSEGRAFLEEAIDLFSNRGQFGHVMFARNNLGFLMVESGHYFDARTLLLSVCRQAHLAKEARVEAAALACLADLEWQSGALDLALSYHHQSRVLDQRESDGDIDYAHLEALKGNLETALSLIHAPQTVFHIQKNPKRIRIALLSGQFEQALGLLAQTENPENHDTYRAQLRLLRGLTRLQLDLIQAAQSDFLEAITFASAGQNKVLSLEAQLALDLSRNELDAARETRQQLLDLDARGHLLSIEALFVSAAQIESKPIRLTSVKHYIQTLGGFALERDGKISPWKASKTRDLLAVLLVAYLREDGPKISKAEIIDILWTDDAGDESTESKFRVTLKRLRDTLGDATSIFSFKGMYELRDLKADVVFFLESLGCLDFDAALGWYKGEFLLGIDIPDAEIIRAQLWQRFRDTALKTSFETPNVNLLEKLHHLEPLDLGILERYLAMIADDAFRIEQVLTRAKKVFERETGEIPNEFLALE